MELLKTVVIVVIAGVFADVAAAACVALAAQSSGCAWFDVAADGALDLFVTVDGGANLLLHGDGDGTFTDVSSDTAIDDAGSAQAVAWVDFDGDSLLL